MRISTLLFICIFCFGLVSCCDDDDLELCNTTISGVDSFLDIESESYLMNYMEHDSIYFTNQINDTILLEVVNRVDSLFPYTEFSPCLSDSTMITYREGFHQQQYEKIQFSRCS